MIHFISNLEHIGISSLLVRFRNSDLEKDFSAFKLPTLKQEVRAGCIIASLSWILLALMEPLNTPRVTTILHICSRFKREVIGPSNRETSRATKDESS